MSPEPLLQGPRIFRPTTANLARLAALLRRGELVGVPSETVYGLAAVQNRAQASPGKAVADVCGGCGADVAEGVGARRSQRATGKADEATKTRMPGHPNGDGRTAGAYEIGHDREFR